MNFITLRDIRKGHSFGVSSPTDADYVRIAKAVFDMLRYVSFCAERGEEELKRMAIKLTLYFEDMVSDGTVLSGSISNCTASRSHSIM